MQKVGTYTKFKINEKTYRWRDDRGCWYTLCPSVMQVGFHEVPRSENDLLEKRYQGSVAHTEPDYKRLYDKAMEELQKCNHALHGITNGDETLAEATQTDQDKTASDVYPNTPWIHPVNETEEPTRPSEEDMINKPSVNTNPGRAYTEGVGYEQKRVVKRRHEIGNIAVEETFEKTYDQHPQFRDIGIRIDRYGKLVFKPELSNEED